MATYLFVSYPENVHEAAEESCFWTCSSTTEFGDQILVYVTETGIQYEWRAVSDAEKVRPRVYECLVEYVRTFDPPVTLEEICHIVRPDEWRPPHLNLRGYKSLRVPDKIVKRLIAGRSSFKKIVVNPDSAQAYCNRGNAYTSVGRYTRAIWYYDKAIQRNPAYTPAYSNRGFAHAQQGRFEKAMADYEKAIQLDRDFVLTYSYRGLTYVELSDYARAIADCNKAVQLAPNDAFLYYDRAIIYHNQGKLDEAIADYNRAIQRNARISIFYCFRGTVYFEQGDYNQALTDYDQAIKLNPYDGLGWYNRGMVYAKLGKNGQATTDLHRALELETDETWREDISRQLRKLGSKPPKRQTKLHSQTRQQGAPRRKKNISSQPPKGLGISSVEKLVRIGSDFDVVVTSSPEKTRNKTRTRTSTSSEWTTCPICQAKLKAKNLAKHKRKIHKIE